MTAYDLIWPFYMNLMTMNRSKPCTEIVFLNQSDFEFGPRDELELE